MSTEEQAEEGWSVDAQERVLRELCKSKDWQVVMVYKDEGRTGTNTNRPGFQSMLRDAQSGKFDVIVVHKLDRFSRNLVDVLQNLHDMQKLGVTFVSATEANMDFTTPSGRMMLVMLAFFAEWYVENLRAETTKGKKERFDQGLYNGDLRFGYSKGADGKPELNGDANAVRLAYEWCAEGKTDAQIATMLNIAGYRTYRLISNRKKKADANTDSLLRRPWTKDSVAMLLRAGMFYLGHTEYIGEVEREKRSVAITRGERYEMKSQVRNNTHPAIITQEQYEQANAARSMRTNPGRLVPVVSPRIYLLGQGLARCSVCGEPLRCSNGGVHKDLQYYQCAVQFRGMSCSAPRAKFREELMCDSLNRLMNALALPNDWQVRVQQLMTSNSSPDEDDAKARIVELKEDLRRLNMQYQMRVIADEEYVPSVSAMKAELARLERQSSRVPLQMEHAGDIMISIQQSWQRADKAQRRDMLALLFEAVEVDVAAGAIVSVIPHPDFVPLMGQTGLIERDGRFYLRP